MLPAEHNRRTPYNTGKVLIGRDYTPVTRPAPASQDMENLQLALLNKPKLRTIERIALGLLSCLALVVLALDLFVWRP